MIIGINGKIGSGKDTVGMLLQALTIRTFGAPGHWADDPIGYLKGYEGRPNLKGGWTIKKYAAKLKQIASILTGIPIEKFEDQEFKKTYLGDDWNLDTKVRMTVREFLQKLGTEGLRDNLHQNTWVNALMADYKDNPEDERDNWIITDVRFPNEAQAIKDKGGIVIRVVRDRIMEHNPDGSFTISGNPENFKISMHPSEIALDDWQFDQVIYNDGTLEELLEKVKAFYKQLVPHAA